MCDVRSGGFEREPSRVVDPFWESDEVVDAELVVGPVPEGWEPTSARGIFALSESQALAVVLETRDARGRRWRHLHVGLPLPYDDELAEGIACELLGAGATWVVGPRRDPVLDDRTTTGFHVCLDDPAAVPPIRAYQSSGGEAH